MPRSSWKANHVQIGLPIEAHAKLSNLATTAGLELGDVTITRNDVATWAVHHLLSLDAKQAVQIVKTGRAIENTLRPGPHNNPGSAPAPASKTSTRVWTRRFGGKEPRQGDGDGLDGHRPARRKVSDTPACK